MDFWFIVKLDAVLAPNIPKIEHLSSFKFNTTAIFHLIRLLTIYIISDR